MRSMNMLVFPGIDMLQKFLLNQENKRADTGVEQTGPRSNDQITPEVANGYKPGSSSGNDTEECDDGDLHHSGRVNGEARVTDSDSQCPNVSVNDTCATSGSSDASPEPNDETTGDTRNVSRPDGKCDANPSSSHDAHEVQNKAGLDCSAEDNRSDDGTDTRSGNKVTGYALDGENLTTSTDNDAVDKENKTASDSAIEKHTRTHEECDMEVVDAVEYADAVSDAKTKLPVEETSEMEMKIVPDSPDEHNSRSSKGSDTTSNDDHQVNNVTVSNEIEARVSAKGNTLAGSESGDELAKPASPGMETKSTSDLGKDVSDSCGGE
ncbi:hypothetical protein GQ457_13G025210 [Hibiscus cannabinus]